MKDIKNMTMDDIFEFDEEIAQEMEILEEIHDYIKKRMRELIELRVEIKRLLKVDI